MTPTDALARFRRMHGDNVFFPIGFDAFGLPAENAAIKNGGHPFTWTMQNIENMRRQFRSMGATFAWKTEVVTADPSTTAGTSGSSCASWRRAWPTARCRRSTGAPTTGRWRASRSRARIATAGAAARSVEKRDLEQWFLRTTAYADELLDFTGIDWPEPIKIQQTNWIGRSEGAEIDFETAPDDHQPGGDGLRVFTTRPDTLFGATFMVLAPEHPLVATLTHPDRRGRGRRLRRAGPPPDGDRAPLDRSREDRRRDRRRRDQPGQRRAHPDLHRRLRPGRLRHRRDHGRAGPRRARLRVRAAVRAADPARRGGARRRPGRARWRPPTSRTPRASGWSTAASSTACRPTRAAKAIVAWLAERAGPSRRSPTACATGWSAGSATGARRSRSSTASATASCPSPTTTCRSACPRPSTTRAAATTRSTTTRRSCASTCPRCGGPARRETDTMDTFIDSSWYWFRYLSPHDGRRPGRSRDGRRWTPVDQYTGGAEHAVMHLLYSRFFTKAMARHRPHPSASRSSGCSTRARSWARTASG